MCKRNDDFALLKKKKIREKHLPARLALRTISLSYRHRHALHNGHFILQVKKIKCDGMQWLGLFWYEGIGASSSLECTLFIVYLTHGNQGRRNWGAGGIITPVGFNMSVNLFQPRGDRIYTLLTPQPDFQTFPRP